MYTCLGNCNGMDGKSHLTLKNSCLVAHKPFESFPSGSGTSTALLKKREKWQSSKHSLGFVNWRTNNTCINLSYIIHPQFNNILIHASLHAHLLFSMYVTNVRTQKITKRSTHWLLRIANWHNQSDWFICIHNEIECLLQNNFMTVCWYCVCVFWGGGGGV